MGYLSVHPEIIKATPAMPTTVLQNVPPKSACLNMYASIKNVTTPSQHFKKQSAWALIPKHLEAILPNSKVGCASKTCKHAQAWSRRIVETLCAVQKGSKKLKRQSYQGDPALCWRWFCVRWCGLQELQDKSFDRVWNFVKQNRKVFSPRLFWKLRTSQRHAEVDEVVGQQVVRRSLI